MARTIILEGFDGAGKSTLATSLAMWLDRDINTIGGPPSNDFIAEVNCFQQYMKIISRRRYVFDRCTPISRLCYEHNLSRIHERSLHKWLMAMKQRAIIVYCRTNDFKHERAAHDTDAHLERVSMEKDIIIGKYESLMKNHAHITFDPFNDSVMELKRGLAICL